MKPEVEDVVLMGMGVEKAGEKDGQFSVQTPGSIVTLDKNCLLRVRQRIGTERELLSCQLPPHLAPWRPALQTPFRFVLQGNGLRLTVQGDSILIFEPMQHIKFTFEGHYRPGYSQEVRGNRLILDQMGGCGFYGIPSRPTLVQSIDSDEWSLTAHLARWDELWVSICPPRERDVRRYFEQVAHEGNRQDPYPSDEIIRSDAKYCKVFTVHECWAALEPDWAENPPGATYQHPRPWETDHPVPGNMKEFARVRDEAHKLGMKFVVYFSPYYSNAPDLFAEMKRIPEEYGVDGLYFDGWWGHQDDFRLGYHLIRKARAILGDKILYLHSSTEPYGTCRVYLPFVSTYADYILSGEAGRDGLEKEEFLRYTVSGYQTSNSVGMWCYYGSMGLPGYHDIIPPNEDIQEALRNHIRFWRPAQSWSKVPEQLARFDKEYYGGLAELKKRGEV